MTDRANHWCAALYRAHAAQLLLYGRSLGLSHAEAEDVLHDTFLALMRRPERPLKPLHYCLRGFRNCALNYRRSLWRRLRRELESRRWFERAAGETPLERAAMRCLRQLPPDQREVMVLKIWQACTFEEIGELLGCSPNTAAGRYRYGMEKIRAHLNGADYERLESTDREYAVLDPTRTVGET